MRGPNRGLALARYRRLAATYAPLALDPLRRRAVSRLACRPAQVVLDIGCGTGLSFPLLQTIGPGGRLIGVDQSPEMLARARRRVAAAGWSNVTLVEASAEEVRVPVLADGALLFYTHDVLRSCRALENVVRHVRPGGRIVAAGPRWAPWWAFPANLWTWHIARAYHTTFEGFARPWGHLERLLPDLDVERTVFGRCYVVFVAHGTRP